MFSNILINQVYQTLTTIAYELPTIKIAELKERKNFDKVIILF